MGDGRARGQARQRCAARVAEQVQHADGTASLPYLFLVPCPVHGLLRENAGVLEARGADDQRQIVPVDLPFLRQLFVVIPLPAALGRAVIDSVGLGPQRAGLVVFPDDLRVGTDQQGLAPALQPVVVGSVEQLIIPPCISRAHRRFSFAICVGSMNFVVKAKRQSPSGLVNSASPSDPGPSVAGSARAKASPHRGGGRAKRSSEGLYPFPYLKHTRLAGILVVKALRHGHVQVLIGQAGHAAATGRAG